MKIKDSRGFTIIELMIAMSVLSTILLASTIILIQIGSIYTKGVNVANLQDSNRNILNDLINQVQYSTGVTPSCTPIPNVTCYSSVNTSNPYSVPEYAYCIGSARYSYLLYVEQGAVDTSPHYASLAGQTVPHVIWRDTIAPGATCQPLYLFTNTITGDASSADRGAGQPSSGYDMVPDHTRLTVFYANPVSGAEIYNVGSAVSYGDGARLANNYNNCNGSTGDQYCAVSALNSTVEVRVN